MKSEIILTLDNDDVDAAVLYWIEQYHGFTFDSASTGDKIVRNREGKIVIRMFDEQH